MTSNKFSHCFLVHEFLVEKIYFSPCKDWLQFGILRDQSCKNLCLLFVVKYLMHSNGTCELYEMIRHDQVSVLLPCCALLMLYIYFLLLVVFPWFLVFVSQGHQMKAILLLVVALQLKGGVIHPFVFNMHKRALWEVSEKLYIMLICRVNDYENLIPDVVHGLYLYDKELAGALKHLMQHVTGFLFAIDSIERQEQIILLFCYLKHQEGNLVLFPII